MNVLLVCHAGTGTGLGHMARCLVVARALQRDVQARVQMLIQSEALEWPELASVPHRFVSPQHGLSAHVLAWQTQHPQDVVVFDLQPQRIEADFADLLAQLRASGCKLVAVDGLLRYRPLLDLIFTPSFHLALPPDLPEGAPIVMGWDCFLLNVQETPRAWQTGRSVLALTGGSDATALGQTWPSLLDSILPPETELHWVTGPFAAPPQLPATPRIAIQEHVAPAGLGGLMVDSNYAVTVFGVSFFELMSLGIPTVVFSPYGDKDNSELALIAESGAALVARDERDACLLLLKLMQDATLAGQLSRRSLELLSTPGATRLCAELLKLKT